MQMKFCPLYSGSSGNCTYIATEKTRLLVDAGMSGKMLSDALNAIQRQEQEHGKRIYDYMAANGMPA